MLGLPLFLRGMPIPVPSMRLALESAGDMGNKASLGRLALFTTRPP